MKSVDIFPWNDNFNTGVAIIDEQHRKLVDLLNRLATQVAYKTDDDELNQIFDELADYTIYHFQTEEGLWNRYLREDPLDSQHQAIHQMFVDKVLDLKRQQKVKATIDIVEDALAFLADWLASHILETDRYMAYIILAVKDGTTLEEAKKIAEEKVSGSGHAFIEIMLATYSTLSKNTIELIKELKVHKKNDDMHLYEHQYRQLLLDLSTSFINLPINELDNQINISLEQMSNFIGADRAYIFDYNVENATTSNTHEWCAQGITPHIEELQGLPINFIPDWLETHKSGNYVLIENVSELPQSYIKEILLPQNIKSLITFPLFLHNNCIGFVGFDSVKELHTFTESEITILKLFSTLLANVNERKETETSLSYETNFLKTLIKTIPDLIWLKDTNGIYLECNSRFEDFFGATEGQIVGKTDYDFKDKELADFFIHNDKITMESGKAHTNEELLTFASDGHQELISTTKVPMYSKDGKAIGVLGIGHDMTEQKRTEESLRLAASVFTHSREGIMITSPQNTIVDVNDAVTEITGYTKEELIGKNPKILSSNTNPPLFYEQMWKKLKEESYWDGEIWNRHKNGTLYAEMVTISVVKDDKNKIVNYLALFSDITPIKEQQKRLEYIAHYDALTGLPNRVLLSDRLKQAIAQTQRKQNSLALVYLDLDGFKDINDNYGHDYGDELLSLLAKQMKHVLRDGDTIARLGGDEFVAVLSELQTHDECIPLLERLLKSISTSIQVKDVAINLSASLGVSFYDAGDRIDPDQLLRYADQAMYQAKVSGKNRYHIFDVAQDESIRSHHEKLETIQAAFKNNEFTLYYQPKVNMRSGEVVGFEALIRWNHPQEGVLSPAHFLPTIEAHPFSIEVGEWVIEEACKQILLLKEQNIQLCISVNISALHLLKGDFINRLTSIIQKYPSIEHGDLMIEILETSALEDLGYVSSIITDASKLGVDFSLDDFGTGYSSLTYLKRLSVAQLKIDQSFIRDMLEDSDDLAIIQGVITLANAFHREIVAEGIESIEHGEILLQLGCEIGQGYAIARPMPATQLIKWLKEYEANLRWKETKAIDINKVSYLYAMAEHTAWLKTTLRALQKSPKSSTVPNSKECQFGLWIERQESQEVIEKTSFKNLKNIHHEIHELADKHLYAVNSSKDIQEAQDRLINKSQELMKLLKTLSLN